MKYRRIRISPKAIAAIQEGLSTLYAPPQLEASALRDALARKYRLSPEQVVVGNGSTELMNILAQQQYVAGAELVISTPTFSLYPALGTLYGYRIKAIPLRNYTHDLRSIVDAITPQTSILFLDSPHYITGTALTTNEIETICQAAPHAVVVIDNVYGEFQASVIDASIPALIATYHNMVICRTFSKAHALLGLRVGYTMGSLEIMASLQRHVMPYSVNALAQRAALASLEDEDNLQRNIRLNRAAKDLAYRKLEQLGLAWVPTESSTLLILAGLLASRIEESCGAKGIKVRGERKCALAGHLQTHLIDPVTIAPVLTCITEVAKG